MAPTQKSAWIKFLDSANSRTFFPGMTSQYLLASSHQQRQMAWVCDAIIGTATPAYEGAGSLYNYKPSVTRAVPDQMKASLMLLDAMNNHMFDPMELTVATCTAFQKANLVRHAELVLAELGRVSPYIKPEIREFVRSLSVYRERGCQYIHPVLQ